MNADKMKTPLLLVHGEADNNPGTFNSQTERYFQALKGLEHQQEWLFYQRKRTAM
jgi:dipeptidyl aminopeptidase/acylaminoacyl peptidase